MVPVMPTRAAKPRAEGDARLGPLRGAGGGRVTRRLEVGDAVSLWSWREEVRGAGVWFFDPTDGLRERERAGPGDPDGDGEGAEGDETRLHLGRLPGPRRRSEGRAGTL